LAGLTDAPFLEFPFDPPEWSLARRDYIMAKPLEVDGQGWITLGDAPGMGYALDEQRLLATRIG
jgi:L-alanine-DL-glutamate epimerase-like enolase superfamily enzyme